MTIYAAAFLLTQHEFFLMHEMTEWIVLEKKQQQQKAGRCKIDSATDCGVFDKRPLSFIFYSLKERVLFTKLWRQLKLEGIIASGGSSWL